MRKIIMALCLSLPLGALAGAEEAAPASGGPAWISIRTWFEHLKEGLSDSAVRKNYQRGRSISAVAAVRGAGQKLDDPSKPYWRGAAGFKEEKQRKKERTELSAAVDLILAGKTQDGAKALDAFEASHPKSPLLPDLREAREKLKAAAPEKPGTP